MLAKYPTFQAQNHHCLLTYFLGNGSTYFFLMQKTPYISFLLVEKIKGGGCFSDTKLRNCKWLCLELFQESKNFDESRFFSFFLVKMSFVLLRQQTHCCDWTPNKTSGWMWLLSSLQGCKSKNTLQLFVTAISASKMTHKADWIPWQLVLTLGMWCATHGATVLQHVTSRPVWMTSEAITSTIYHWCIMCMLQYCLLREWGSNEWRYGKRPGKRDNAC